MGRKVAIDLITRRPDGAYVLVLVEEGFWTEAAVETELRRLQTRLHDTVDAAVDGFLASKYPEAKGRRVIVRLDCYDVPRGPVEEFFSRFSRGMQASADLQADIETKGFISQLDFEFNWRPGRDR